jgi:uncharacterized damage-inducible protein DinB
MKRFLFILTLTAGASTLFGADTEQGNLGKLLDAQLRSAEREIVSLAEAMPAEKYNFHPTGGELGNVRTFSQQMSHIAAVLYSLSSGVLGEKNPTDMGKDENGPASIQGNKEAVVKYMKDAFVYAHKATNSLSSANATDMVPSGNGKAPRINLVSMMMWHSFDHYGQSVIYVRMNGIVPPASRPR